MLTAVRLTLSFLTPAERVRYVLLIAVRALTGLLDVAGIGLIAFIAGVAGSQFDASGSVEGPTIAGIQLPRVDADGLFWLVVAVLGVFIVKATIAILLMRTQAHFVAGVETRNALRIADYLLHGSLALAKRSSKAELQFALTGSSTYAFTGLLNNVASLICESFLLLVITATFFVVNPLVAVFALVYFALVVLVIQVFIGRSLKRAGREAVSGTVETMNSISNTLDTFREISVLHKQALFIDRIAASRARIARSGATMTFLAGMPRYVVETALILGVVILVAQQFFSGELSSGLVTVGVFLAGGVRMMASLLPLQSAVSNMKGNVEQAKVALDLLVEVREASESEQRNPRAVVAAPAADAPLDLELVGVGYRYPGAEAATISDVSISVPHGRYAAVIGPSGAGKTTIVDLVLGLITPDSGTVTIGGVEPTRLRAAAPGLISYVPQKPGIVSGSIAENIALGVEPSAIDRSLLAEVVEAAYLTEFLATLPDGVDTSVGAQGDALSGGQVQRIGVARALYSRPRVLVLDEATSGLDAGSEAYIASTLRALHGSVTVVVIAHRLSTVQHADVVYVVENGRITASGDFAAVRKAVPMVEDYVKLMSFESAAVSDD